MPPDKPIGLPTLSDRIGLTLDAIRRKTGFVPEAALILGTGLGSMASALRIECQFDYADLPYFPETTADHHQGKLLLGTLENRKVAVFQGRLHVYEGYTAAEVAYPVRVAKALGAGFLVITNIAGGLNPDQDLGDILVIYDQINLMGVNPLVGPHEEALGPRFPDMSRPYDKALRDLAGVCAEDIGQSLKRGVYAAMTGPSLETAAEYRMLRMLGADAIGMSTVPEVIVAAQAGLRVLGLTLISDLCDPDHLEPMDLARLFAVVGAGEPKLAALVQAVLRRLDSV